MTNLIYKAEDREQSRRAREHSVIRTRARGRSVVKILTKKKHSISTLLGPLFTGPKDLRIQNVEMISIVGSLRSNSPQFLAPEKTLINVGHVTPPEVTSRLRKANSHTLKGNRPTPTIKDSSDTSILEPEGQVYWYGTRPS